MTEPASLVHDPAKRRGDFAAAAGGLVMAAMLAALAGMVDVVGYLHLKGLFVSFMSGNSTQLGAALGQGDLATGADIAELVGLFVLGAAAGQMLADAAGRRRMTWVLIGVMLLLTIAAALRTAPEPMVFAMGALNASMQRAGNIPVVLVRFGQGLGSRLTRRATGWSWLAQAVPWAGMIAGATIGGTAYLRIGELAIWAPIALAAVLAAGAALMPQSD